MTRRLILAALAVLLVLTLLGRRIELSQLLDASGAVRGIGWLGAVALQLGAFAFSVGLYRGSLAMAGVPARWRECLSVLPASLCLGLLVPSAGLAGATLWVAELGRRGHSRARVAAGVALAGCCDLAAIFIWSVVSLVGGGPETGVALPLGTAALGLVVLGMAGGLALPRIAPAALRPGLDLVQAATLGIARWARRKPWLAPTWSSRVADELVAVSAHLPAHPARITALVALGLSAHAMSMGGLLILFRSFGQPGDPLLAARVYATAWLVWVFSPVPQGIGVVEGATTLTLVAAGFPTASATGIALAFRGLVFWLPLGIGALLLARAGLGRRVTPA